MTLRRKFLAYLLFVHLVIATVIIYLLWDHRIWLLAVEVFFLVSFLLAVKLYKGLFEPLELITSGVQFMKDGDFTAHLREFGQPEMDTLIGVYNKMIDHLRTERVKTQEQHFFLEKIMNVSPAAIITLDYDGKISFVNPASESLLQVLLSSLPGKSLSDLEIPFAHELDEILMGNSVILPLRGIRKVRCFKSYFLDRGHPRTFYMIEELTDELRKTEKSAYEKLIRMMAHEVNNSLGAAKSLLHSCLHYKEQLREADRSDFETAITVAIARTDHLGSFMKSFADIVKLPQPQKQLADVLGLLQNLVPFWSQELAKRNIQLLWQIDHKPHPILMDGNQMEQVFLNILKNAMEAINDNGTITITLGRSNRKEFVSFRDTGAGISPEVRQYLFTPFFSTKEHGQGIGLTLVQEILTRHNFEFSLESTPGSPTDFTIFFS